MYTERIRRTEYLHCSVTALDILDSDRRDCGYHPIGFTPYKGQKVNNIDFNSQQRWKRDRPLIVVLVSQRKAARADTGASYFAKGCSLGYERKAEEISDSYLGSYRVPLEVA